MYIIAGLGNPTSRYDKTRHNIGFDVMDALADEYHIDIKERKSNALCGSGFIAGQKVVLVKPQTYMNNSGEAISALLNFYKLDPESEFLVIYDDICLDPGKIRVRMQGSAGGHNGVKNIIRRLGTQNFARIKVGVGEKPKEWDLADYVLGHFSRADRELVDLAMKDALAAVELIVQGQGALAMNRYNKKNGNQEKQQ